MWNSVPKSLLWCNLDLWHTTIKLSQLHPLPHVCATCNETPPRDDALSHSKHSDDSLSNLKKFAKSVPELLCSPKKRCMNKWATRNDNASGHACWQRWSIIKKYINIYIRKKICLCKLTYYICFPTIRCGFTGYFHVKFIICKPHRV